MERGFVSFELLEKTAVPLHSFTPKARAPAGAPVGLFKAQAHHQRTCISRREASPVLVAGGGARHRSQVAKMLPFLAVFGGAAAVSELRNSNTITIPFGCCSFAACLRCHRALLSLTLPPTKPRRWS